MALELRRSLNENVRVDSCHFGPQLGIQKLIVIQMISKRCVLQICVVGLNVSHHAISVESHAQCQFGALTLSEQALQLGF